MEVSFGEGKANNPELSPCIGAREDAGEAVARECAGQVSSSESYSQLRSADVI